MKEKDLHKIIQSNSSNDNTLLADALKQKHPELASKKMTRHKWSVKRLVAVFAPMSAAAVLALVLIPTLLLSGGNSSLQPDSDNSLRTKRTYHPTMLDCSVSEYNDLHNTNFLYFDAASTDYKLIEYRSNATNEFLGLGVRFTDKDTDDKIEYVVCANASGLDFLDYNIFVCTKEQPVGGYSVKWGAVNDNAYGIFSYDNYGYYITLKNNNQTRLFELIQILTEDR